MPRNFGTIILCILNFLARLRRLKRLRLGLTSVRLLGLENSMARGRWRKRKGIAKVRLSDSSVHLAEIHWYEATGVGRKEYKIKRLI